MRGSKFGPFKHVGGGTFRVDCLVLTLGADVILSCGVSGACRFTSDVDSKGPVSKSSSWAKT